MHKSVDVCRLCLSQDLKTVIDLGTQALTGIFPKTAGQAVYAGPLQLVKCLNCGLVQLADSYPLDFLYGDTYGYRSGLNASMVRHLADRVRAIESLANLKDSDLVVDIGANDGTLLGGYQNKNLRRIGIDPSGQKFFHYYQEGIELIPAFFSAEALRTRTSGKAKVVTSIAMFYDLERPMSFVEQIVEVLDDDGIWVFEQSYIPTMLATNSYDTICHEHLEYYSLRQIVQMTEAAGLKIVDIELNDTNGGSFAVTAAKKNSSIPAVTATVERMLAQEKQDGLDDLATFESFRQRIDEQKDALIKFLTGAKSAGKLVIGYGASTKGNVVLQYCGITPELLPWIAEVNEDKFGAFTPGTLIPIIAETEARAKNPDYFLVFPWHFRAGILAKETAYLASGGRFVFPLPTLDIVSA